MNGIARLVFAAVASASLASALAVPAIADSSVQQASPAGIEVQPIDLGRAVRAESTGRELNAAERAQLQSKINDQLQRTPGGTQISSTEVSYLGGNVVVVFPLPGEREVSTDPAYREGGDAKAGVGIESLSYYRGCPYGSLTYWKCLYDDTSWGGRMVQYKDFGTQNLPSDFYNRAESAVNTGSNHLTYSDYLDVYTGTGATGTKFLTVQSKYESGNFNGYNNTAKSIGIR